MPTSVRLDSETEALLQRLVRTSGRTKSEILREALARYSQLPDVSASYEGPYSLVADLVGIAEDGPSDLAGRHKRAFREALAERAK